MSPVAISGVDKQGVYVNGVQVKQALNPANETVNKGVYDATLLSTVDADLAAGNIKDTVNIFGKVGTVVEGTLAEDVEGDDVDTTVTNSSISAYKRVYAMTGGEEITLATKTLTFDANSLAFAAAFANAVGALISLRLYMGGVLMGTSANFGGTDTANRVVRDFKVLSGNLSCEARLYSTGVSTAELFGKTSISECPAAIAVGSVKLV